MEHLARVAALYRYPVKGLTPERLDQVAVTAGETFPYDRAYAIENGPGRFDPVAPKHLPKINFLMLMRDERLATLRTSFSDDDQVLTVLRDGKQVARGQLTSKTGRAMIEQFMAAYMKSSLRGAPKIVSAPGHAFSDVADKCIHIVNLASLRELERTAGRSIDPLRFRANVYIDDLPPWAEFDLVGQQVMIDQVGLDVWARTVRCDATNVDPTTGARDLAIPNMLSRAYGHMDFGVYASITSDGVMKADAVMKCAT
ncbi:MAG: MOSC N-terminal beta barrel domain-containing protein [Pseudomonadota bacterium]